MTQPHEIRSYEINIAATNITHLSKQAINYVDVLMAQEAITPETHQLITDNLQCAIMHSERIANILEATANNDSGEDESYLEELNDLEDVSNVSS